MNREKILIVLGFIVISLIWGSTWLAIKIGLSSIPPLFAVALRFTLAMSILFVVMRLRREHMPVDRSSMISYAVLAVLSFSFPFALVYWGEQYIISGLASILFAMYPFVVALVSHLYLPSEKLNSYKVIGILLGFFGVTAIFWSDVQISGSGTAGMVAILCSSVLQGTSLVITKKRASGLSPIALTFGGMVGGVIILFALAFLFERPSEIHLDARGVGSILYLGSFGSVATFLTYYWLLKRVEAAYLSLVAFVTPVIAVLLGVLLLDERLSPRVFFGASLICSGILIANGKDVVQALQDGRKRFGL